jgi:hypothetical protein
MRLPRARLEKPPGVAIQEFPSVLFNPRFNAVLTGVASCPEPEQASPLLSTHVLVLLDVSFLLAFPPVPLF